MLFKLLSLLCNLLVFIDALSSDKVFRPTQQEILNPNVTPLRSVYGIKSIQADYWNTDDSMLYVYVRNSLKIIKIVSIKSCW